jgi:predicted dienelactone hydrolase
VIVRQVVLHLVDRTRSISVPGGGSELRPVTTIVRYPVGLPPPLPLVVFGHGFAETPGPYTPLLEAWTKAGYVVAAPVFPLGNENAPGGPNEQDLPHQPRDMSLVISALLARSAAASGTFSGMVRRDQIAVAGQSDGGDTALAAAYDPRVRDTRVRSAVILSGAFDPFVSQFAMPAGGVPLLAVQGTADTINPPGLTYAFYDGASAPKYLLRLIGAPHLAPYTQPGPELRAVERVSLAFLDCYLKRSCRSLSGLVSAGGAGSRTALNSEA